MTRSCRLARAFSALLLAGSLGGCMPSNQGILDGEKEANFQLGKSRISSMDYQGAVDAFEKSLEVNPRFSAAHFELAWLYDQKVPDPAAAIYHYERFLRLQPSSGRAEAARTRILACKQELARGILPTAPPGVQRDLDQLAAEHARLRDELERWRAYAARMQIPTNAPPAPTEPNREVQAQPSPPVPPRDPAPAPTVRFHTVKPGDNPSSIARLYNVRLDALMGANPGLDARRLRVGQSIRIPPS